MNLRYSQVADPISFSSEKSSVWDLAPISAYTSDYGDFQRTNVSRNTSNSFNNSFQEDFMSRRTFRTRPNPSRPRSSISSDGVSSRTYLDNHMWNGDRRSPGVSWTYFESEMSICGSVKKMRVRKFPSCLRCPAILIIMNTRGWGWSWIASETICQSKGMSLECAVE